MTLHNHVDLVAPFQPAVHTLVDPPAEAAVLLTGVSRSYHLGEEKVWAVRDVSLRLDKGELAALIGPSGSGKSTLLHIIGCLDAADSGSVSIDGVAIEQLNDAARSALRSRRIGFVFQSFNLIPVLSVYENVELPLLIQPEVSASERKRRTQSILAEVGLSDHAGKSPERLSGGQRQRVAIARALVTEPAIVLADEPTANLDSETALKIVDLMSQLNTKRGVTFLFSTHDERLMTRVQRLIRLRDGSIAQ